MSWWLGQLGFAAVAVTVAALASDSPPAEVEAAFSFVDPSIDESSGLLVVGDRVLTVDDSGDGPVIYVVDGQSGDTVGRTTCSQGSVEDVEALAAGPDGSVWVGDIGDNGAERDGVSVYRLPAVETGDQTVAAQRFDLRYEDGPQNAEALLIDPRDGRLFVVTKGVLGGRVYAAPPKLSSSRTNLLREVGSAKGLITDGAFFSDGAHAVLRTYGLATVYDTSTWEPKAAMRLPSQKQGEGIAVIDGGRRVLISSEGANSEVLSVALAEPLLAAAGTGTGEQPPEEDDGTATPPGDGATDSQPLWQDPVVLLAGGVAVLAGALAIRGLLRRRDQSRWTT
ncbi:MAG: hypothetical protein AVDCRST_MAG34-2354 [uncultured Nocardioidaceae bacterium]|uniref:Uncharacterized protein n=1 Tax=uncultured Nocardioidaceae bacterium TaxID=253824 RepID=A0A6J4MKF5_9ACTN|nr:MAG: hypothetical protein AVDCRST_MAG34-2354 [uncultured Nocardioidaceae bacterium]